MLEKYVGNAGGVWEMERDYESRSRVIVSVEQMISKVFKLLIKCENSQLIMKKDLLYYIECDTIVKETNICSGFGGCYEDKL